MPQPATWTADRLPVGRVVWTEQVRDRACAGDEVAVSFDSGGDQHGSKRRSEGAAESRQLGIDRSAG